MLSFTSNSYFVSINSVSIIRNCRPVTIQIKLVLINYLSTAEESEAASEVELGVFTLGLQRGVKCPVHFRKLSKIPGTFPKFTGNFPTFCNPNLLRQFDEAEVP